MFERYRQTLSIALTALDILLINVAFALAYWMRYDLQWFAAVDPAFRYRSVRLCLSRWP